MRKIAIISICFISLLGYFLAPNQYDYLYCVFILILFILSVTILIVEKVGQYANYFNFYVLFALSFFYVNFVYPIFIYPIDPYYFFVFQYFDFDSDLIPASTALAQLGFSFFCLGAIIRKNSSKSEHSFDKSSFRLMNSSSFYGHIIFTLDFIQVLLVGSIIILTFDRVLLRDSLAFDAVPSGLLTFTQVVITLNLILSMIKLKLDFERPTLKLFITNNKLFSVSTLLYVFMFILAGDRGPAIQTVLAAMFTYSIFIRPIRLRTFVFVAIFGMLFLTVLSYARNLESRSLIEASQTFELTSFVDIGMDLVVNNRNLYVGYEIVQKEGLNYGKSMFYYIFSPFPLLPQYFSLEFFGQEPLELATSSIITEYSGANYGLGTNLIADLYMQFGVLGVIFFMFVLGHFINLISNRKGIISLISIVFFVSFSIYISRSSMFDAVRFIAWAYFLYYFLHYFFLPGFKSKTIR